jgi:hypothetical protein
MIDESIKCLMKGEDGEVSFTPSSRQKSRLQMMAATDAVAKIPESVDLKI